MTIELAQAQAILEGALAHARAEEMPPMSVAILDAGGGLAAFMREDGSSLLREKIARAKAMSSLNLGVGSRALVGRAESHPQFFYALVALSGGNMVPVAGGVLIRGEDGVVIGAVGVSGYLPDADEACAIAGVERTPFTADPGD